MENINKKILLKIDHISKNFGSVTALEDINFEVYENEIVAIVGDNGAGKSTLIKIISGNFSPDGGELFFDGKKTILKSPSDARKLGIETVYQDLSICNNLDSVSNLYIGREIYKNILGLRVLNVKEMKTKALKTLGNVGINIPSVDEKVEYLSGGQRQAVILARFLEWGKRLILLDEPTAALGVRETKQVLELIRKTKNERKEASFVLISHNLQQVFEIADRIIVLRLGKVIGIRETQKTNSDEIVSLITGSIFINNNKSN
jgi:D-xylose transport system ATP-binding protein